MSEDTKSQMEDILNEHYPDALRAPELVATTTGLVEELGFSPKQTKPKFSLCRDDSIEDLREALNEAGYMAAFNSHALAGNPATTGKTSVGAWYHHIPDEGMGLIYVGPHIGIDSQGNLGQLDRAGQNNPGKSCGAHWAIAGLWESGDFGPYEDDIELSEVSRTLSENGPARDAIMDAPMGSERIRVMTEHAYTISRDRMVERVSAFQAVEEHQHPILIVAGVNVDTHHDDKNAFQVRDIYFLEKGEITRHDELYKTEL